MDIKIYILQRYSDNGNSTQGLLFRKGHEIPLFKSYTLEDEYRIQKIPGETRIPEGKYEIKKRKSVTPKTVEYRGRYPWFDYHLEILDVPNFSNIYIHVGNKEDDTDGCVLVQNEANNNQIKRGWNSESAKAFKRIYMEMSDYLDKGIRVFIHIKDEYHLIK